MTSRIPHVGYPTFFDIPTCHITKIYHKNQFYRKNHAECRVSVRSDSTHLHTRRFCCIYPSGSWSPTTLPPKNWGSPPNHKSTSRNNPGPLPVASAIIINPAPLIPAPIHPPRQSNHGSRRAKTRRKTKGTWIAHTGPSVYCTISSLTATFVPPQVNSNQLSWLARNRQVRN